MLMTAYKTSFQAKTSSPDDTLFKSFRDKWEYLDQNSYHHLPESDIRANERHCLIEKFEKLLEKPYHREDYAEFLQLGLMCLTPAKTFKLRPPGAMHHARWMAKGIYSLKMYLFRGQFEGEGEYHSQLKRFVLFVLRIYIKVWYDAPLATSAPRNDLNFMKSVKEYQDPEIGKAVSEKFENHLWYISEYNIALAFFDQTVSLEDKRKMVKRLSWKNDNKVNCFTICLTYTFT